jgi:hypothetical protein
MFFKNGHAEEASQYALFKEKLISLLWGKSTIQD